MGMENNIRDRLSGVFTALVTPFKGGGVDWTAFDRLLESQLASGVHGLVPVGTTAETATLSEAEVEQIVSRTVKASAGKCVVAGAGSNSTATTIENAKRISALGVDGLLIVAPYYNRPTQRGLLAHFSEIAEAVSTPIMLYSVPGRCGVEIAAETCATLSKDYPHIVGIKEAGGRPEKVTEILRASRPGFIVHSGDDALTLPFLSLGASGVTSVASNYLPKQMVSMYGSWQAGDAAGALRVHNAIFGLLRTLFIESNPVPVKAALAMSGAISAEVRRPLVEMDPANLEILRGEIQALEATLLCA